MLRKLIVIVAAACLLAGSATAGDLFKVTVKSQSDAETLKGLGPETVFGGHEGYLVLVETEARFALEASGLEVSLLATNISRDELAIDGRLDRRNVEKYPLLYEEGNYRLYRADATRAISELGQPDLFPVGEARPAIRYAQPERPRAAAALAYTIDLDSLIDKVSQDSLQSYTETLQAFDRRVSGTVSNYNSRDWIAGKLTDFGYDSVVIDSFQANLSGTMTACQNVLAYKVGTRYPGQYIVVGAHRDAVPGSPGADDNGSGTAGVLEIARILKDVETEMTFVFALFDAEEYGLHGSWYYADRAVANGDSIVYMLNMDMIGHYENTNVANLYHGTETSYSQVWQILADSLLNLSGYLAGASSGSDHYPFAQNGYTVTFVAEYIFSSVYHSSQDSTTYMNFGYMTKMVKASLATVYVINDTEGPAPSVVFTYPYGTPTMLAPDEATAFEVQVDGAWEGVPVPGSEQLHYAVDGGGYTAVPLVSTGGNLYEATLPAVACGSKVTYYVSAQETTGGTFYSPDPAQPLKATAAFELVTEYADDFESDLGWTSENLGASSGNWQRGIPVNDPSWTYGPAADGDGSGQCYVTDNGAGNTDVDGGAVRLTSPVFDMSDGGDISYQYYLYLNNTSGAIDRLSVEISNGGSWIEIVSHDTDGGRDWRSHKIEEADLIAAGVIPGATMQIRFTANDDDPQSVVEAGIDGFMHTRYSCDPPGCCGKYTGGYTGNANYDVEGKRNLADISKLIDRVYISKTPLECEENGNVNGDLENKVNLADISRLIDHVYISKEETASCP